MYELSHDSAPSSTGSRLRHVIRRLASLGLFTSNPSPRSPSFWPACLHQLLQHLHPGSTSPLPPYPPTYLPSVLLPLPTSTLNPLIDSLLVNFVSKIDKTDKPSPSSDIHRAAKCLVLVIGPAEIKGEALEAVLGSLLAPRGTLKDRMNDTLARVAVAWVALSSQSGDTRVIASFLDTLMDEWTDQKYIRFALYAQQFSESFIITIARDEVC